MCTVCNHEARAQIDGDLARGTPVRLIARKYGLAPTSIRRHRDHHLSLLAAEGARLERVRTGAQIARLMEETVAQLRLLLAGIHKELRDPEDPQAYDLSPRAANVTVVYRLFDGEDGKPGRPRKARLSDLLELLNKPGELVIDRTYWKVADPRELLPRAADSLSRQVEMLVKVAEELRAQRKDDLTSDPRFARYANVIAAALRPFPDAAAAVESALAAEEPEPSLPFEEAYARA